MEVIILELMIKWIWQLTGDIFSKGSWGSDVQYRYKKRYKFNSNFNFSYAEFIKR